MNSIGYRLFNKINIISVAYRDKRIIDTVTELYDKSINKKNLIVRCGIQDSHKYDFNVDGLGNHNSYMTWDDWRGFARIRHELFNGISDPNSFVLFINPGTRFNEGWDHAIMEYYSDMVSKTSKDLIAIGLDNDAFDSSAFFIRQKTLAKCEYPKYLKLKGENEEISLRLNANNISIFSGIEKFLIPESLKVWDHIPFSINHNYNKVIELYQKGYNEYVTLTEKKWQDYAYSHMPKEIFDQLNDVEYDKSNLPALEPKRFYSHNSRIG